MKTSSEKRTEDSISLPLRTAYLCAECRQIMDGVPLGICRCCGSIAVRAVAELLLSAEDRQSWLDLVHGQIQTRLAHVRHSNRSPSKSER